MENRSASPDPGLTMCKPTISAIVPARNEEATIAACVESLARQPEIAEILVVNDQSTDRTADIVRSLLPKIPHLRHIEAAELPAGWVGKNHAVWLGAKEAKSPWLLFTDADATLLDGATARALAIAAEHSAALVSFSPEQALEHWYEKALIPFVYCRLAKYFSYDLVNNPASSMAAANGQFLLIQRETYDAVGGHAGVAAEVLEDVALAKRVKAAGARLWFGSGEGSVRVRMYRSFGAMWRGWKKNLYLLIGGTPGAVYRELLDVLPWIPFAVILCGFWVAPAPFFGVVLILFRQASYGADLRRNHFRFSFILYYIPAAMLYACLVWVSYRSHAKGRVEWKGREYTVAAAGTPRS